MAVPGRLIQVNAPAHPRAMLRPDAQQEKRIMKASDVMMSPVITVRSTATAKDVAKLFLDRKISAAPVVDAAGKLMGIVSEGDLIHRTETGTERRHSPWLTLLTEEHRPAADYINSHATKVADVMTPKVVSATPDTPLQNVAMLRRMPSSGYPSCARPAGGHREPGQPRAGRRQSGREAQGFPFPML